MSRPARYIAGIISVPNRIDGNRTAVSPLPKIRMATHSSAGERRVHVERTEVVDHPRERHLRLGHAHGLVDPEAPRDHRPGHEAPDGQQQRQDPRTGPTSGSHPGAGSNGSWRLRSGTTARPLITVPRARLCRDLREQGDACVFITGDDRLEHGRHMRAVPMRARWSRPAMCRSAWCTRRFASTLIVSTSSQS